MGTRKYRLRTTCLSCGKPVSGTAVVVVTELPEDGGEERALIVHEGRHHALVRDPPYQNLTDKNTSTDRPRF